MPLIFALSHYLFIIVLALIAYLVGRRLTGRVAYQSTTEELVVCVSLGLGVIGYLMFGLGLVGWIRPAPTLIGLAALLALTYPVWPRLARAWRWLRGRQRATIAKAIAIIVLATPILLMPLYPPVAYDGTMYHLPYAKQFITSGYLDFIPNLRYPVFPQLNEMLFTLAMVVYDDVAAQLTQFLMLGLVTALLYVSGKRLSGHRVGVWAAAIWLSQPIVLWIGAAAYVDIGLTLFICLGMYTAARWRETHQPGWIVLAGVFMGYACGTKYLGIAFFAFLAVAVGYWGLRDRSGIAMALFVISASLVAAPWYVRNWVLTHNPVFPYYPASFGYTEWSQSMAGVLPDSPPPVSRSDSLKPMLPNLGMVSGVFLVILRAGQDILETIMERWLELVRIPWELLVTPEFFGGESRFALTPIFLLTLPLLVVVAWREPRTRGLLALALVYSIYWRVNTPTLRYWALIIPILCLSIAIGLAWLAERLPKRFSLWRTHWTALGFIILILPGWLYAGYKDAQNGLLPVTQAERDAFLLRRFPSYSPIKLLNDTKGSDYTVYVLFDENMAYHTHGVFLGSLFGPARYIRITSKMNDSPALYADLRSLGVGYLWIGINAEKPVVHPTDDYFLRHFKPIYTNQAGVLYELVG